MVYTEGHHSYLSGHHSQKDKDKVRPNGQLPGSSIASVPWQTLLTITVVSSSPSSHPCNDLESALRHYCQGKGESITQRNMPVWGSYFEFLLYRAQARSPTREKHLKTRSKNRLQTSSMMGICIPSFIHPAKIKSLGWPRPQSNRCPIQCPFTEVPACLHST